jgi:hypothetical protein
MIGARIALLMAVAAYGLHVRSYSDWHAYGCHMADGTPYRAIANKRSELPKGCAFYERFTHGKAVR